MGWNRNGNRNGNDVSILSFHGYTYYRYFADAFVFVSLDWLEFAPLLSRAPVVSGQSSLRITEEIVRTVFYLANYASIRGAGAASCSFPSASHWNDSIPAQKSRFLPAQSTYDLQSTSQDSSLNYFSLIITKLSEAYSQFIKFQELL